MTEASLEASQAGNMSELQRLLEREKELAVFETIIYRGTDVVEESWKLVEQGEDKPGEGITQNTFPLESANEFSPADVERLARGVRESLRGTDVGLNQAEIGLRVNQYPHYVAGGKRVARLEYTYDLVVRSRNNEASQRAVNDQVGTMARATHGFRDLENRSSVAGRIVFGEPEPEKETVIQTTEKISLGQRALNLVKAVLSHERITFADDERSWLEKAVKRGTKAWHTKLKVEEKTITWGKEGQESQSQGDKKPKIVWGDEG